MLSALQLLSGTTNNAVLERICMTDFAEHCHVGSFYDNVLLSEAMGKGAPMLFLSGKNEILTQKNIYK